MYQQLPPHSNLGTHTTFCQDTTPPDTVLHNAEIHLS